MEINISAIVPVYGVEKYLPRCLRSLEEQTIFERVEVILIDDGSPDRCGVLCDEFAARHPRNVRVIHKVNGGLSDARNVAMDAATGDYYLFLDSDDYLRPDACEILAKAAEETRADFIIYRLRDVFDDDGAAPPQAHTPRRIIGNKAVFHALASRSQGMTEMMIDKMVAARLFKGLRFPVGMKCEDAFVMASLAARAESALVLGDVLYFYRQRPGSTMRTRGDSMVDDRVAAHEEIVRIARKSYPESLEAAKARTYHIRIVCLNAILDCPHFRQHLHNIAGGRRFGVGILPGGIATLRGNQVVCLLNKDDMAHRLAQVPLGVGPQRLPDQGTQHQCQKVGRPLSQGLQLNDDRVLRPVLRHDGGDGHVKHIPQVPP